MWLLRQESNAVEQVVCNSQNEAGYRCEIPLRFQAVSFIRGEVSACSCNPSGKLVKVINIGIRGALKLTQGGIVLNISPEVFNRLGSQDISRYLPNDSRDENRRPLCLKCE